MIHHVSFLRQKKFLEGVMKQLEEDPKPVLDKLQECSKKLVIRLRHSVSSRQGVHATYNQSFCQSLYRRWSRRLCSPRGPRSTWPPMWKSCRRSTVTGPTRSGETFSPGTTRPSSSKKAEKLKEKFLFVQDSTLADPNPDFHHAITGKICMYSALH